MALALDGEELALNYEGHSIYMTGIHHVESKNIQGMAVIKLFFYPGTDMAGAMAEAVGYTLRAKGFMPPGTLPPFILRYDTGSVPVGYLVIDSDQAQSPFVTRAMWGVGSEGLLGAALTGLMVLLFLRDWRSVVVVVLNIPLALMGARVALWATGRTINLMSPTRQRWRPGPGPGAGAGGPRLSQVWGNDSGQWFRSYGNELWEFDDDGLMRRREASINDVSIAEAGRRFRWPAVGPRPADHPGIPEIC